MMLAKEKVPIQGRNASNSGLGLSEYLNSSNNTLQTLNAAAASKEDIHHHTMVY